jgi:protease-4
MRLRHLLVIGLLILLPGCTLVSVPLIHPPGPLVEQSLEGEGKKKILLLDISGTISEQEKMGGLISRSAPSSTSFIRESLQKAEKDTDIVGVILRINSPGGTVTGSDILHHDITEFKKRKKVPVYGAIVSTGASGGYYVAAAADRIYAHPTAITGSIGVILMKFNVEGLMGKIGVEEQTVKSGDKKDIMSPFRKSTPEEVRLGQEIIDQLYERFLDTVLARPGNTLTRDELRKVADGRIYTARQALNAKLIDQIAYLDDVISELRTIIGDVTAQVVTYYRPGNYKGSIYADAAGTDSIQGIFNGLDLVSPPGYLYLWNP